MKRVNVYDFDKTIFKGDSTKKFYIFLLKRNKKLIIFWPKQIIYFILFLLGIIKKTTFKEKFYSCFKIVKDIDKEIQDFWDFNTVNIKDWYYKNQKDTDIIISASPEFLLEPLCSKIGIKHLIASKVDRKSGKYTGLNCYGQEKVLRLRKEKGNIKIKEFYSDSFSDQPLANLAEESYIVVGDKLYDWKSFKQGKKILKKD